MKFHLDSLVFRPYKFSLENGYESELLRCAEDLFPCFHYIRWAPLLTCEFSGEGVKPDGLLISHDFQRIAVVEVELARKSKISDMVDQIGKLARVDYMKHIDKICSVFESFGCESPREFAKLAVANYPGFVLIIDGSSKEMENFARKRDFIPIVIECYRSECGRILLQNRDQSFYSLDQVEHETVLLEIRSSGKNRLLADSNYWWVEIESGHRFCDHSVLEVRDSLGVFSVPIESIGEKCALKFPLDRRSIRDVWKGNRVGVIRSIPESSDFQFTAEWDDV